MKTFRSFSALVFAFFLFFSVPLSQAQNNWAIAGNPNILANNFLGTTNNVNVRFRTNNVERMVLTSTGELGIGTTTPAYRLSVATSTGDRAAWFSNTFNTTGASYSVYSENTNTSTGHGYAGYFSTTGVGSGPRYGLRSIASGGNNNFGLYASATSAGSGNAYGVYSTVAGGGNNYAGWFQGRVYVSTNLGIGEASPDYPLEFNNVVGNKICLYDSGNGNIYGFGVQNNNLLIHSSHSGSDIAFGYGSSDNFTPNMLLKGTGSLGVGTTSPLARLHVSASNEPALIAQVNGSTKLRVHENGSVSVGSPTQGPSNGMYISGTVNIGSSAGATGYKLAVNGKAVMEEVKVQLSQDWPDYVFESDYQLPDLRTVKAFIDANGHLPGISSAAEINHNGGIELGEMQRKMMEKIEELTLYIIQLEEKMEAIKTDTK